MDCEKARDKMIDYIEQQLDKEDAKKFEEHMQNCPDCQKEFDSLEKLKIKLKNIKDLDPNPKLKENIMGQIHKLDNKKPNGFFRRYGYLVASFCLLFLGGYIINNNINKPMAIASDEIKISPRVASIPDEPVKKPIIKDNYLYEKTITKDMKTKIFRHDLVLFKNDTCYISFENTGNSDVIIKIEDIDGNVLGKELSISPNTSDTLCYKSSQEVEEDLYSVSVECSEKSICGNLKIETKPSS